MKTTFPCRVQGCGKIASPGYFLCPQHYVSLPGVIQRELKRAWRDGDLNANDTDRKVAISFLATKPAGMAS
jgi:hypothetical protein